MATASKVHRVAISSDQINMFRFRYFETQLFDIFRHVPTSFRRKPSGVSLCKSIESAIQWFRIHLGITFVPYIIQLYTFRVQGFAHLLPWFPDYSVSFLWHVIWFTLFWLCSHKGRYDKWAKVCSVFFVCVCQFIDNEISGQVL